MLTALRRFLCFMYSCFICTLLQLCSCVLGGGPGVSLTLSCFVVYSTRRFVLCLSLCYFVLVFFSPFSIAITSLGKQRANLSAFRTSVRFALVWFCLFPLPLVVWEGLRFVIVALPGLFPYPFLSWLVPHLFFCWRLRNAVLLDCGLCWPF